MSSPTDKALVAGLAAGREDAFADAYDRFAARLLAVAWGMLGSREEAEDAVQNVFTSLVQSRAALRQVENLPAYLFASLRHAAARRARRAGERAAADPAAVEKCAAPQLPGGPAAGAMAAEQAARLEQALASLPPEQREVVALKVDGGLTFDEIATVLGIGLNTAASRYRYALEKLRERLKE